MADGIGNIGGYGNYGFGYVPQRKDNQNNEEVVAQQQAPVAEETQIDPSKVMDFLANNNFFVAPAKTNGTTPVELSQATQDRVAGYMEKFEMIYGVIQEEFGEELAPTVMDMVMDSLMGM